ncbi:class I adenylate-forming enzyme family protein [Bradyrhizobium sp.]|uniref:class I adenylate-forming enzyme family protein n=1 Tax=Bradyrhizobium sp. TaxID=376 RepID=UPI003C34D550
MRRSSRSLAALLGIRRSDTELFRCASGGLTADELLFRANLLAGKLPNAKQRVIVPSDDPIALLAGIAGCWLGNDTAVAWRTSAIDLAALTELTAATMAVRWDDLAKDWRVERLTATPAAEQPGDIVILTSGSTGKPKGVALHLGRVAANAALAGSRVGVSSCEFWAVDADMSLMSPLAHTLMAWSNQVSVQHLGGLAWNRRTELFAGGRGGYGGAPLQIRELGQRLAGDGPRVIVSSGDFLPQALAAAVEARFPGARLHKIYGLTEVSGRLCVLSHDQRQLDPAAAGFPLPGFEVFIAATETADEPGEICVTGPTLMCGYWRPGGAFEPTEGSIFRTGDLGAITSNGLVTVSGRRDDVFKVGGEKVDRHSIELALQPTLAEHEFCVLPVIHPVLGQMPALFVAGADLQSLPPRAAIVQAVRGKLPPRCIPSMTLFAGMTLPKLPNGKLDKQLLMHQFQKFPDLYARQQ